MFWRNGARSLLCFYCNQRSPVAQQGRIKDWKCPSCDALNILDDGGNIADSIPQKYQQESKRQSRFSSLEASTPSLSTPFCSVCTSNQALLIKTLANYLPEDDHPDIDVYERALPAYRASLEDRYPPVCSACVPLVQTRLQRNNYVAKSSALGKWLNGAKEIPRSGLRDTKPMKVLQSALWLFRLLIWVSTAFLMLTWYLSGLRSPANQKFGTQLRQISQSRSGFLSGLAMWQTNQEAVASAYSLRRKWLPISLFGAVWNPKGLSKIMRPAARFTGSTDYVKLQGLIQAIRFASIYGLPLFNISVDLHKRLSALFLLLSICHLLLSFTVVKEIPPKQLDLKDRSGILTEFIDTEDPAKPTEPPQMPLQLRHEHMFPSLEQYAPAAVAEEGEEEVQSRDELMDWQPSPPSTRIASPSPFITSTAQTGLPRMFPQPVFSQPREQYFSTNRDHRNAALPLQESVKHLGAQHVTTQASELRKQTFFAPERPTGLENLFNAAVRLDDEPILVQSIKSVRRNPLPSAIVLICLSSLIILTVKLTLERSIYFVAAASCATLIIAWSLALINNRPALYGTMLLTGLTIAAYSATAPRTRVMIEWIIIMLTLGHQAFITYDLIVVHKARNSRQPRHAKKKTAKVK